MCRYHRFVVSWRPTIKASLCFTINLSFLQLKAPSKQSGSRAFGLHTTCLYCRVEGWPHLGKLIQDTPYLTSSGRAVVRCFPLQVQGITIPLSPANWKLAGAAAPDTCYAVAISRHGSGQHVGDLLSGLGAVALLHKGSPI